MKEVGHQPVAIRRLGSAASAEHHLPGLGRHEPPRVPKWEIEAVEELREIERLEKTWREFTSPDAAPFQTFTWNCAWYRHFSDAKHRPFVLVARRNGRVAAILPCYLSGREIRLAGDETCDYQDILAAEGIDLPLVLEQMLDWVRTQRPGHRFRLQKLSSKGKLYAVLGRARKGPARSLVYTKPFAPCPCAELKGGLEGYLDALPRKKRQDLRRALNRMEREVPAGRVEISCHLEIRADLFQNAADFHVEHFRKHGTSPLADGRLRAMLGEVAKDPDVGLQLARLVDQGDVLAVDFGFARGGTYFGYLTAFDPAYRSLAPGKCLLLSRIDHWVEEDGVATLDFLAGDEEYKLGFTEGGGYGVHTVRVMPAGAINRYRLIALETDKQARKTAKRVLERVGML